MRVGLLWHSTRSGNLGVGALTMSNLLLASRAAERAGRDVQFKVIGMGADVPSYGPEHVPYQIIDRAYLLGRSGYRSDLGGLDCVLDIGGGDSFADIYGAKRFAYLWLTKAIAARQGVPFLLAPQTIGPFTRPIYRQLAGWALRRAAAVVARDPLSMEAIRELAPGARAIQSVDVAFALPFERQGNSAGRRRIGVNVSGMLFNESEASSNRYGLGYDYSELCRALIRTLSSNAQCQVELICHVSSPGEGLDDDGPVADRLAAEFPGAIRVPAFATPSEAKSYISGLDFLIAGRMHACIAAFSTGVPFVATAYSRKFTGLFGMLGYPATLPEAGMSIEDVLSYILNALERAPELSLALSRGNRQVESLLENYVQELEAFFRTVPERITR